MVEEGKNFVLVGSINEVNKKPVENPRIYKLYVKNSSNLSHFTEISLFLNQNCHIYIEKSIFLGT